MAWNENNGILTADGGYVKIAVNRRGDIQRAIGARSRKQSRILTGLSGHINPLALWKPTRSDVKLFASAADRRASFIAAGCGFGDVGASALFPEYSPAAGLGPDIPSAPWEYLRPRIGVDPLRPSDMAPGNLNGVPVGYYKYAVSPIQVMWPGAIEPSRPTSPYNTFVILFDGSGDAEHWRQNLCISVDDLFPNSSAYSGYRFAVVFRNARGTIVAVAPQTVLQARYNHSAAVNVATEDLETLLPSVGDTVNCAVCLIQNTGQYSATETTILTDYTGTVTSLEIETGCDRTVLRFCDGGSIAGITGSATLTMGTRVPYTEQGFSCYYPIEQIDVTLTPGSSWGGLQRVKVELSLACTGAMGDSEGPGSPQTYTKYLALTSSDNGKTFTGVWTRGVDGFDSCAYVVANTTGELSVTFKAVHAGDSDVALSAPQSPILLTS